MTLPPLFPAKAGTQVFYRRPLRPAEKAWTLAFARESGVGGLPARAFSRNVFRETRAPGPPALEVGGRRMKFGIFYEISVPRPWGPETERQVYDNCIEQCVVADEVGFDHVWAVEHHFLEEYSHCSAPEIFLATVAAKTKNIRVGHGINVCVPEINHPIRIAERSAVLDIVSHGRLDVGTGRSATWTELGGFRANPDLTKATWAEFVRALPKMWMNERYAHDGVS